MNSFQNKWKSFQKQLQRPENRVSKIREKRKRQIMSSKKNLNNAKTIKQQTLNLGSGVRMIPSNSPQGKETGRYRIFNENTNNNFQRSNGPLACKYNNGKNKRVVYNTINNVLSKLPVSQRQQQAKVKKYQKIKNKLNSSRQSISQRGEVELNMFYRNILVIKELVKRLSNIERVFGNADVYGMKRNTKKQFAKKLKAL